MSRKVNKIIEIGYEEFTLKPNKEYYPYKRYNTIFDAYVKPSLTKISIWEDWVDWFYEFSEGGINDDIFIVSRNSNIFCIGGIITYEGIEYTFYISPTKNELFYY